MARGPNTMPTSHCSWSAGGGGAAKSPRLPFSGPLTPLVRKGSLETSKYGSVPWYVNKPTSPLELGLAWRLKHLQPGDWAPDGSVVFHMRSIMTKIAYSYKSGGKAVRDTVDAKLWYAELEGGGVYFNLMKPGTISGAYLRLPNPSPFLKSDKKVPPKPSNKKRKKASEQEEEEEGEDGKHANEDGEDEEKKDDDDAGGSSVICRKDEDFFKEWAFCFCLALGRVLMFPSFASFVSFVYLTARVRTCVYFYVCVQGLTHAPCLAAVPGGGLAHVQVQRWTRAMPPLLIDNPHG